MIHALTRPFVVIGCIALLIIVITANQAAGIGFASNMSVAVIDIAKAIIQAVIGGLEIFGSDPGDIPTPDTAPSAG